MPRPHYSPSEIEIIRKHYGTTPMSSIEKLLPGRTSVSIMHKANRLGLKNDRTGKPLKHHSTKAWYFKEPTTRSSYWAGFIAADGCVFGGRMLQVFQSDRSVIERFAREIDYQGPVLHKNSPLSGRPNYYINVYSREMVSDLWQVFGIGPKKSLMLTGPVGLSHENALAFVTGYIDGDGSICRTANGRLALSLVGTRAFLSWVRGLMPTKGSLSNKPLSVGRIRGRHIVSALQWSPAQVILETLLSVSGIDDLRLPRKWDLINGPNNVTTTELHLAA